MRWLACAALALSGCFNFATLRGGGCATESDCPLGSACTAHVCTPSVCASNAECSSGLCLTGHCAVLAVGILRLDGAAGDGPTGRVRSAILVYGAAFDAQTTVQLAHQGSNDVAALDVSAWTPTQLTATLTPDAIAAIGAAPQAFTLIVTSKTSGSATLDVTLARGERGADGAAGATGPAGPPGVYMGAIVGGTGVTVTNGNIAIAANVPRGLAITAPSPPSGATLLLDGAGNSALVTFGPMYFDTTAGMRIPFYVPTSVTQTGDATVYCTVGDAVLGGHCSTAAANHIAVSKLVYGALDIIYNMRPAGWTCKCAQPAGAAASCTAMVTCLRGIAGPLIQ
jgi:hypothetical protein